MVKEKKCPQCNLVLDAGMFSPDKSKISGLRSWCKPCSHRVWKEKRDPVKERARLKAYAAKEESKQKMRDYHLKRNYGISLDDYNKLHEQQGGVCAICGNPETVKHFVSGRSHPLHLDHDHTTGKVRGLLCTLCNTGLGKFKDDKELLKKALEYLNERS